jgi:hypothetical protein
MVIEAKKFTMSLSRSNRKNALLVLGSLVACCFAPILSHAAGYGSLSGIVSDNKGVPLMGATVLVTGPTDFGTAVTAQSSARMLTDAHGRFTLAHLLPGWYSLNVSSPTRLPAMRNGVHVEAGMTSIASFVLADVFAPVKLQVPGSSVSSWGDDWKWVLRGSSSTRPILRYRDPSQTKEEAKAEKALLPPNSYYMGVLPGLSAHDPLAEDFGMASVAAYLQPLSPQADVLAEASFAPMGGNSTTVGTAVMRSSQIDGTRQEAGIALHQFDLVPGAPTALNQARGMVATYTETRLIYPHVTVTTGIDISYLGSFDSAFIAQPRMNVEYQPTSQTVISMQYGSAAEAGTAITDRLTALNAFPLITEQNSHLEIERLNHTELTLNHRIGKSARLQVAAYHDSTHNAAVWGMGISSTDAAFTGNSLPNPAGNGIVINGGSYSSSGFRAVFAKTFDSRIEVLGAVTTGNSLSAKQLNLEQAYTQGELTPQQTAAFLGKVTAEVPLTHTRISTSYECVPADRVTLVDPAMQGALQAQPYLGVQIRQPIPTPNSWPVRIDAVAEFQNLLSQGYVPSGQNGQKQVVVTSGYHYVRGGFAVQF